MDNFFLMWLLLLLLPFFHVFLGRKKNLIHTQRTADSVVFDWRIKIKCNEFWSVSPVLLVVFFLFFSHSPLCMRISNIFLIFTFFLRLFWRSKLSLSEWVSEWVVSICAICFPFMFSTCINLCSLYVTFIICSLNNDQKHIVRTIFILYTIWWIVYVLRAMLLSLYHGALAIPTSHSLLESEQLSDAFHLNHFFCFTTND